MFFVDDEDALCQIVEQLVVSFAKGLCFDVEQADPAEGQVAAGDAGKELRVREQQFHWNNCVAIDLKLADYVD